MPAPRNSRAVRPLIVLSILVLAACDGAAAARTLLTGDAGGDAAPALFVEAGIDDTGSYAGRHACRASLRDLLGAAEPGDAFVVRRIADDSSDPSELVAELRVPESAASDNPFDPTPAAEVEASRARADSARTAAVASLDRLDAMPEPEVTDIAGWLVAASGSLAAAPAGSAPVLLGCSDWIDTRHRTVPRVDLGGARVVLLHYTFEGDPDAALERQAAWRELLLARGAAEVVFWPTGRTPTLQELRQPLREPLREPVPDAAGGGS